MSIFSLMNQEWTKEDKLTTSSSSSSNVMVGAAVKRNIEGVWFHAIVQSSCCRRRRCTIKYTDDDNVEDVSFDDLQNSEHMISNRISKESNGSNNNSPHRGPRSIKDSLPKPLAGMLLDDSEERINHLPTITVHTDDTDETAIIINGGKLGNGCGLRALRYLKK